MNGSVLVLLLNLWVEQVGLTEVHFLAQEPWSRDGAWLLSSLGIALSLIQVLLGVLTAIPGMSAASRAKGQIDPVSAGAWRFGAA